MSLDEIRKISDESFAAARKALEKGDGKTAVEGALTAIKGYSKLEVRYDSGPTRKVFHELIEEAIEIVKSATEQRLVMVGSGTSGAKALEPTIDIEAKRKKPEDLRVSLSDMCGLDDVIQDIKEAIEARGYADILPVKVMKGALLYGPPGCGKSALAEAVAKDLGAYIYRITGGELLSMYYGGSSNKVHDLYTKISESGKDKFSILVLDEYDAVARKRMDPNTHEATEKVVDQFLAELDDSATIKNVFTIATTNLPYQIDTALIRPGRLKSVYIGLPNEDARSAMFEKRIKKFQDRFRSIDVQELAKLTNEKNVDGVIYYFTGADIEEVLGKASKRAIKRDKADPLVTMEDFYAVLNGEKGKDAYLPVINSSNLSRYKTLRESDAEQVNHVSIGDIQAAILGELKTLNESVKRLAPKEAK